MWVKWGKNSISLILAFGTYSHILYFFILSVFFKFSTPSQNVQFHTHRSHMELTLPEEIRYCTRKMIKTTHFMSPCKMVNLFQDVVTNFFPQKVSYGQRCYCPQDHENKAFEAPNKYYMSGKLNHTYRQTDRQTLTFFSK